MGYQRVEAILRDHRVTTGIVYNAELAFLGTESQAILKTASYRTALQLAAPAGDELQSIRAVGAPERRWPSGVREALAQAGGKPASDGAVELTKADEQFVRFSAYEKDRRITADGALLPGTYSTTEADARNAKTGKDAVARYALPNPAPASYRFTIAPKKDTPVQYGTVQPANGHLGGGAEVIFSAGTHPGTVTGPVKIPDE